MQFMKNIFALIVLFFCASIVISCNQQAQNKYVSPAQVAASKDSVKFTAAMVDNKRDPSCGMPVAAGIGDTAHYKGKVLGFCSKECKDEFLKDPEKNISAANLK